MTFTYDPTLTADRDKVRRLINDVDSTVPIFVDAELDGFLAMQNGFLRAAAMALDTIASNEAYVLKVMTRGDLQTNGAATAAGLRAGAVQLRTLADKAESDAGTDWDVSEWVLDDFSARQRLIDQALREQLV